MPYGTKIIATLFLDALQLIAVGRERISLSHRRRQDRARR